MRLRTRQRILLFIQGYIAANGFPPSLMDIGTAVGLKSRSAIYKQCARLEERGYITMAPGKARTIRLLKPIATVYERGEARLL